MIGYPFVQQWTYVSLCIHKKSDVTRMKLINLKFDRFNRNMKYQRRNETIFGNSKPETAKL